MDNDTLILVDFTLIAEVVDRRSARAASSLGLANRAARRVLAERATPAQAALIAAASLGVSPDLTARARPASGLLPLLWHEEHDGQRALGPLRRPCLVEALSQNRLLAPTAGPKDRSRMAAPARLGTRWAYNLVSLDVHS
jgi:hypothetical protein